MVRIASIVLLLLITSLSYGNNARLRVTANSTTIEIGKPLLLNISAYNIDKNITSINMDILLKNFGFQVIESSRKLNKNKDAIQELKISLYPHYTGEFKIPSLELGGYRSAPLAVTILPALEKNKTLSFNSTISSLSSWQRQQVIMTISVLTHSKFARIKLDDLSYNEIESYTLGVSREKLGNGQFRLTSGWVFYPFIAGKHDIDFPAVNYRLKGKVQRKFIPKGIHLNVKALPSYIPPLMPVGKINIDKRISKNSRTDSSTHTLSVNITSNHVLTSELPGFPRDYFIDKDIVTDKTASTFTTNLKDNKFSSIVQHRIPISFNASGQYKFPEITYKYFEPDTGKIVSVKDKPQSIFILSNWLKIALLIILVMILIRTIITAIKHIMYLFKLKNRRKRIVNSILAAETPHALHQFLNDYAKTYQWGSNMTLEDWRKTWVNKRKTSPDNALRALSIACYTKNWDRNTQPELNKEIYLLLTR